MQVTNTTATTASASVAGVFGQQNQGGSGLFGLLMNLFGQMGLQAGQTGADGQIVPTALASTGQTATKLPVTNILDAAITTEGMPTDAAGLLNWLQNLAANKPAISAELKSLLAPAGDTATLDLATFQQRLNGLDEASRDEVMGEIAALLQPVLEKQMVPVALPQGEQAAIAEASLEEDPKAPIAPLPEDKQKPIAQLPEDRDSGMPQAPVAAASAKAHAEPDKPAPSTAAITRKNGAIQMTMATETPKTAESLPAALGEAVKQAESIVRTSKTTHSDAAASASQNAGAAAITAAPDRAQATSNTASAAASTAATKPIAATGADNRADADTANLGADTSSPATQPLTAQEKAAALPFADHLQNVKLNRTGAHMPVADQISVQLNRALGEGKDRFTVKLSPGELGRIEIRIEMGSDGQITASFKVDQPATLDLLQRDQRGLERMLTDAGLKADSGSLNFNLRGDGNGQHNGGQQAQNNNDGNSNGQPRFGLDGEMLADETPVAGIIEATWYAGADRLDVRV